MELESVKKRLRICDRKNIGIKIPQEPKHGSSDGENSWTFMDS